MSASHVMKKVKHNDAGMGNSLPKSSDMMNHDQCCGIHGAARERKGIKRGTSAARRRYEKDLIESEVNSYIEEN